MSDKTYTSEGFDPQFCKDMLTKLTELFAPKEYDNPEGRRVLGEEIDKALEEVKKKIEDGKSHEAIPQSGDKA